MNIDELKHGLPSTYTNKRCRCDLCKEAIREYNKSRRQGLSPEDPRHGTPGGYSNHGCRCLECKSAIATSNANTQRDRALRSNYGISEEEWKILFESQGGRCASCRDLPVEGKRRFHVDHDHVTGRIRGIVCHGCNVALGYLKDDPERIQNLKNYLEGSR